MKIIFDFDDTLSDNKNIKDRLYSALHEIGISYQKAEEYYKEERATDRPFSMKKFLEHTLDLENKNLGLIPKMYEGILSPLPQMVNKDLLEMAKKVGKENCYIVTHGDEEYQEDKIGMSGIKEYFSEIHVVPGTKKEIIADICQRNPSEIIIFVDDKEKYFADLDMNRCSNLKTILFDQNGLEKLKEEIKSHP